METMSKFFIKYSNRKRFNGLQYIDKVVELVEVGTVGHALSDMNKEQIFAKKYSYTNLLHTLYLLLWYVQSLR